MNKEICTAFIFVFIYIFVFLVGEFVKKWIPKQPEISRKTVHFLGGVVALFFPYFISSHWTVLVLAISSCLIMVITKRRGILKSVYGVKRKSYGGIYFPIAIYLIFFMANDNPVIYFTSILVMTVSDTFAALVGDKYGAIRYDVEGNTKSIEGSIVFFFVTFLCVHLPLLLATNISRIDSVLIAFIIAVLVTGFEAISLSGSDNIIIPFGTYFILTKMIKLQHVAILKSLYYLIGVILITIVLFIRMHHLKLSGLIALMLLNYASLSLCNIYWFLPLLLAQVIYYFLMRIFVYYNSFNMIRESQVKVVFYLGIIPTILIFAANASHNPMYFYLPYLASITAQMSIICNYYFPKSVGMPFNTKNFFKRYNFVYSFCITFFIVVVSILSYKNTFIMRSVFVVIIGTWVAYFLNFVMSKYCCNFKDVIYEYRKRFVAAGIGVVCVFLLQKFLAI